MRSLNEALNFRANSWEELSGRVSPACRLLPFSFDCLVLPQLCPGCKQKRNAQKITLLNELPPVLIFTLNRYDLNKNWERVKIYDKFAYPLVLGRSKLLPPCACLPLGLLMMVCLPRHGSSPDGQHRQGRARRQSPGRCRARFSALRPDFCPRTTTQGTDPKDAVAVPVQEKEDKDGKAEAKPEDKSSSEDKDEDISQGGKNKRGKGNNNKKGADKEDKLPPLQQPAFDEKSEVCCPCCARSMLCG